MMNMIPNTWLWFCPNLGHLNIILDKKYFFHPTTKYEVAKTCCLKFCNALSRQCIKRLRPKQNGATLQTTFSNVFSLKISLEFIAKVAINNIPALVQIMACRRRGDMPLSEAMMVSLLTHTCVTRPQRVKVIQINPYIYILSHIQSYSQLVSNPCISSDGLS